MSWRCRCRLSRVEGVDDLLEYISLTAELEELRASVDVPAEGTIIETRLDHSQGPIATVLVQRGTLNVGDSVSTGDINGRVRALFRRHRRSSQDPPSPQRRFRS